MPAPSPLSIATSSVQRLLKEESYYHKELASQQVRVEKLEKDLSERTAGQAESEEHQNDEFMLKQEVRGSCIPILATSFYSLLTSHLTSRNTHTHTHAQMQDAC